MDILYWHWIVFGIALMSLEILLTSFIVLWFGLAGLIVGALLWLWPSLAFEWQVLIWTVLSIGIAVAWFKFIKPLSVDKTKAGLAKESLLGQVGMVIACPQEKQRGVLRLPAPLLGSDEWPFIIDNQTVNLGDRVKITGISGNTMLVQKL